MIHRSHRLFNRVRLTRILLIAQLVALLLLADGYLLLYLGRRLGRHLALAIVGLTGLLALFFVLNSARSMLARLWRSVHDGIYPRNEYAQFIAIIVGGCLLLLPGLFSDAVGLLLYLPSLRLLFGRMICAPFSRELYRMYEYLRLHS